MTTGDVVRGYFSDLKSKNGWESHLADDMVFTSFTSPTKQVTGRDAYLQATKRFYSMIVGVEVRELVVEGSKACALTRYQLQPPNGGASFASDVAEVFSVRDDKIGSFAIYFDSAPFPKITNG
jgi:ketosteroid isomerase-like protein